MNLYDVLPHVGIEDETELPGDDIAVDALMEASFEHGEDLRWEAEDAV